MTKSPRIFNYLLIALFTFALGFYMGGAGCGTSKTGDDTAADKKAAEKAQPADKQAAPAEDRYAVPVGDSYAKGASAEEALITIIEFSEFQCPFCSRVNPTITQLLNDYPGQVRVAFKHNPLPFHKDAEPASVAALAAGEQGKFWEMHDLLFQNQRELNRENFEKFAQQIGLDMDKFKAALDNPAPYVAKIKKDQAQAEQFAARGTPHLFINGIRLRGAQPIDAFKKVVDAELPKAKAAKEAGAKDIYAEVIKGAKTKGDEPKPPTPAAKEDDKAVFAVPTGDQTGSAQGNVKGALVTIIEFSDYQCPFCSRAEGTIDEIVKEYGDKVRVFFKHNPLPFHKDAMPASKAALAARNQGKFWEMHKLLFANQKALAAADLEKYAQQIGLNMDKFKKDMADPALENEIKNDQAVAANFGARGTPAFFINGRKLVGAQPITAFKALIDEVMASAQKIGKTGDALYAEVIKNGLKKAEAPAARNEPPQEDPNKVYDVPAGDSYFKGGKNAPVTIVEFSEFQCPFCSRVNPTMKKLEEKYGDKIKVVFKHSPLPFHKDAELASVAALAAGEQGKFWEMHDLLFANQKALGKDSLIKYGEQLGLNMGKFKAALDNPAPYVAKIKEDQALGAKNGARGTPTFFINGKKIVGAQPYENFEKMVEEALKAK
jgi:protein-disulfide isomerase